MVLEASFDLSSAMRVERRGSSTLIATSDELAIGGCETTDLCICGCVVRFGGVVIDHCTDQQSKRKTHSPCGGHHLWKSRESWVGRPTVVVGVPAVKPEGRVDQKRDVE